MPFTLSSFARSSSHANSNVPVTWNYKTNDTQADVNTAGYFNDMASQLNVGDFIDAYVDADGTPVSVRFYVTSNDGVVVDVNDGSVFAATDTD